MAGELGVSENTVSKRTSRALEKLRGLFARNGIATSAEALAVMLPVHAAPVTGVPAGFSAGVGAIAFASPPVTAGILTTLVATMTTNTKIAVSASALIALTAATYTVTREDPGNASSTRTAASSSAEERAGVRSGGIEESSEEAGEKSRRARRTEAMARPKEPNLAMKPAAVSELLKKPLGVFNFRVDGDHSADSFLTSAPGVGGDGGDETIGKTLEMVGATESDKATVISTLKQAKSDLQAAERQYIKVSASDQNGVTLDLSGMKKPVEDIMARTRESLRHGLSSDLAGPMVNAINWDAFYFRDGGTEARFKVLRGKDGEISSHFATGNMGAGVNISGRFPDDGTPIPAEQLFGERWAPFLRNVNLLPVDDQ